jgi:hypothetical protein
MVSAPKRMSKTPPLAEVLGARHTPYSKVRGLNGQSGGRVREQGRALAGPSRREAALQRSSRSSLDRVVS